MLLPQSEFSLDQNLNPNSRSSATLIAPILNGIYSTFSSGPRMPSFVYNLALGSSTNEIEVSPTTRPKARVFLIPEGRSFETAENSQNPA